MDTRGLELQAEVQHLKNIIKGHQEIHRCDRKRLDVLEEALSELIGKAELISKRIKLFKKDISNIDQASVILSDMHNLDMTISSGREAHCKE